MFKRRTSLRKLYLSEIGSEANKYSGSSTGIITEKDISSLPEPVQRYFRHCGYIGKEKMVNAKIEWKDVTLKRSTKNNWMNLDCYQYNFVPEPTRIAYMKSMIFGIVPFEARDKYQDGQGSMLSRLLKLFTVGNARGKEMDESALVTVLAETFLAPSYALQKYIKWSAIDSLTARATLSNNGTNVSGVFHFNNEGEFIRFETYDRYYADADGTFKKIKWTAEVGNYIEKNGIKHPTILKASWNSGNGDFEYFKGKIEKIEFNIIG